MIFGVLICINFLWFIIVMWFVMVIVFFWLWVIMIKVVFVFFWIFISLNCVFWCNLVFNVLSGLLSNKSFGVLVKECVNVICWCWLLEIWCGLWCVNFFILVRCSIFLMCVVIWFLGIFLCCRLKVILF